MIENNTPVGVRSQESGLQAPLSQGFTVPSTCWPHSEKIVLGGTAGIGACYQVATTAGARPAQSQQGGPRSLVHPPLLYLAHYRELKHKWSNQDTHWHLLDLL